MRHGAVAQGADDHGRFDLQLLDQEEIGGEEDVDGDFEWDVRSFGVEECQDFFEHLGRAVDGDDLQVLGCLRFAEGGSEHGEEEFGSDEHGAVGGE